MKTLPRSFRSVGASYQQRGAVLYVALIMLILLALLGIAGMQVAGLQERMAANYRAANRASRTPRAWSAQPNAPWKGSPTVQAMAVVAWFRNPAFPPSATTDSIRLHGLLNAPTTRLQQ